MRTFWNGRFPRWLEANEAWPAGCQSCVSTTTAKRSAISLTSGTISSPCATASAPPGRKSFCTSTTTSASLARRISEREDQLADVRARLHQAVRFGRVLELEGLVEHGLDLAGLDQGPDALAQARGDRALERHRARAQRRARQREAPAPQPVHV